jgi:hypothetical protein
MPCAQLFEKYVQVLSSSVAMHADQLFSILAPLSKREHTAAQYDMAMQI